MELKRINSVLLKGSGKLASGIVTNLLQSSASVWWQSPNRNVDGRLTAALAADCEKHGSTPVNITNLFFVNEIAGDMEVDLAVCITEEDLEVKRSALLSLDLLLPRETIIAVNTASFTLSQLQEAARHPERIIAVNWSDPAYTTAFLEIIGNEITSDVILRSVEKNAVDHWHKDPYILKCDYSTHARFMAALTREAFYLVENGYASIDDIDRACRNDAGYYLPFDGNCRYMDLMGTYAYGLVMKDLNRELSKATMVPQFFTELMTQNKTGMASGAGFYEYADREVEDWEHKFREYCFEIKAIIDKYPFNYKKEEKTASDE